MDDIDEHKWAEEEFRDLDLGDARLNRRLVSMARQVACRPSGRITQVFGVAAEREAAFRLVENDRVSASEISCASASATARRCRGEGTVVVPIDATCLAITDLADTKGFGPISSKRHPQRGAYVMSALAVSNDGISKGLLGQVWWKNPHHSVVSRTKSKRDRRPLDERITIHWVRTMRTVTRTLAAQGAGMPWFQMDRGADCYSVLTAIIDEGRLATVRSSYDRRCEGGYLSNELASPTHEAWAWIQVGRAPGRPPRVARVRLRAKSVVIRASIYYHRTRKLPFNVVEVTELAPPRGVDPIRWRLLTTHAIDTATDVLDVVAGYAKRWHIETFHNAWKSGAASVETSQLRDLDHFRIWATLLASVAARVERLKHRARFEPDVNALEEFTRDEIDAVILLRKPSNVSVGETRTLGEVVRWMAEYGGYTGKSSGGPPGTKIIARALIEVAAVARALAALRERSG